MASHPTVVAAITLALLLASSGQARAQSGIDLIQLNWRVTESEKRLAVSEGQVRVTAQKLVQLTQQLQGLESRFSQLVRLLDKQQKETEATVDRMQKFLNKTEGPPAPPAPAPGQ